MAKLVFMISYTKLPVVTETPHLQKPDVRFLLQDALRAHMNDSNVAHQ